MSGQDEKFQLIDGIKSVSKCVTRVQGADKMRNKDERVLNMGKAEQRVVT